MTEQQWMEAFAAYMAQRMEETPRPFHHAVAEAWCDMMDEMTPEEAVEEEFSYWGD